MLINCVGNGVGCLKMKIRHLIIALFFILLSVFTFLFFKYFEYHTEKQDIGFGKKARNNPYLAAQIYLETLGVDVVSYDRNQSIEVLKEFSSIYITDSLHITNNQRIPEYINWIGEGGHLIVSVDSEFYDSSDIFLSHFDLSIFKTECDCYSDDFLNHSYNDAFDSFENNEKKLSEILDERNKKIEEQTLDNKSIDSEDHKVEQEDLPEDSLNLKTVPDSQLSLLEFEEVNEQFQINFNSNYSLDHPYIYSEAEDTYKYAPFYWVGDEYGTYFMQFKIGEGILSVVSDKRIFTNSNISYYDHAFFFKVLVGEVNSVAILYGVNVPSFGQILVTYMPEFIFIFFVTLILWLLKRTLRFGPIRKYQIYTRRSLKEHIIASAKYIWKGSNRVSLLDSLREEIERNATQSLIGYQTSDNEVKSGMLANISGLPTVSVSAALFKQGRISEKDLIDFTRNLQLLNKAIK